METFLVYSLSITMDIVIGVLVVRFWYSPKLNEIDVAIKGNQEIDMTRMSIWIVGMLFFWWVIGPIEYITKFKRWYPKNISIFS